MAQVGNAIRHPIDTIVGMGNAIAHDFNTVSSPIEGMPTDVLGNLVHGRPQEVVTKENSPNAVSPGEFGKGAVRSAIDLAAPFLPAKTIAARAAVGAGIGALNDPEQRVRGATAGAVLNELLYRGGEAVEGARSSLRPKPAERPALERRAIERPDPAQMTPEARANLREKLMREQQRLEVYAAHPNNPEDAAVFMGRHARIGKEIEAIDAVGQTPAPNSFDEFSKAVDETAGDVAPVTATGRRKPVPGAVNPKYRLDSDEQLLDRASELLKRQEEYSSGEHGAPVFVRDASDLSKPISGQTSVAHRMMQDKALYDEVTTELLARGWPESDLSDVVAERSGMQFGDEPPPTSDAVVAAAGPVYATAVRAEASVAAEKVSRLDGIRRLFAPANRGDLATRAAHIVRANAAEMARANEVARESLHEFAQTMHKLPTEDRLAFIDRMEKGEPQANPALAGAAKQMRTILDKARDDVIALGNGKLEHWIEDYFPHIWAKPDEAKLVVGKIIGKRPLEGTKAFLRQRTIPTTAEGIALGLKPVTDNPVNLTLLKTREMNRYILAQKILSEMKDQGLVKFVRATDKPPQGYVKIDDRVATVSGPLTDEGARTIRGVYHAPEPVARVLNNYLSPGLRGEPLFDAYMGLGNVLNQAQLGFSAFHLGFTSMDAIVSKAALGVEQLAARKPMAALKSFALSPIAPIANYLRGSKVLKEYLTPGATGGEMASVVDALVQAGGRARMDTFYKNNSIDKFLEAFRKDTPGVALHAIPAALELAAKPILEHVVPRQKLGVFADLARNEIEALGPKPSQAAVRDAMARAWDSVDNRMGQLVYDNLFWSKAFKDLSMASVRAVGWNLGTIREVGGGAIDLALAPRRAARGERVLTHKAAYAIALPITVGMYGAVLQYLYTGKGPEELKDYFFPKTGAKNDSGDEERVQLPSYMKDVFAYYHHPVRTVGHKMHPMLAMIGDMLENRDYYGDLIRNPDDPLMRQVAQEAEYVWKAVQPMGIQNLREQREREQSLATQLGSFVGVTPASREDVRSEAENKMAEYLGRSMPAGGTPEDAKKRDLRRDIRRSVRTGQGPSKKILDAVQTGTLAPSDVERVAKQAQTPALVASFKQLPYDQALEVFKLGTAQEQSMWLPVLITKHANYIADHPEALYAAGEKQQKRSAPDVPPFRATWNADSTNRVLRSAYVDSVESITGKPGSFQNMRVPSNSILGIVLNSALEQTDWEGRWVPQDGSDKIQLSPSRYATRRSVENTIAHELEHHSAGWLDNEPGFWKAVGKREPAEGQYAATNRGEHLAEAFMKAMDIVRTGDKELREGKPTDTKFLLAYSEQQVPGVAFMVAKIINSPLYKSSAIAKYLTSPSLPPVVVTR